MSLPPNTKESLLKKTIIQDDCWLFQGVPNGKDKHCKVRYDGRKVYIHRLSAHWHWGFDLESSFLVLHRCSNANCWNPNHLYEGTHADNTADSIEIGTFKNVIAEREKAKTHCPQGHEYSEENTYIYKTGKRGCRTCNRNRAAWNRELFK